jgi:DNA-binding beta-propeller fold protein YncE
MQRFVGATMAAVAAMAVGWSVLSGPPVVAAQRATAPPPPQKAGAVAYTADPMWPKPLPNGWILGSVTGVAVDAQDHIWIVHRGHASLTARTEAGTGTTPPTSELCCKAAPAVLEFDQAGTLVSSWDWPDGIDKPESPGGIAVDAKGNIWITASGFPEAPARRGGGGGRAGGGGAAGAAGATPAPAPAPPKTDAHVLQFTKDGKFIRQIGKPGVTENNASQTALNRPAGVDVDTAANEVFVADGHGNRRVVVFDAATGAYKRHWGAYGAAPDDANPGPYDPNAPAAKTFRTVSCVTIAKDGNVYVCDRQNNRIQVFTKAGKFVKEAVMQKGTLGNGAVWDIALSSDAAQQHLFVADGSDQKVIVVNRSTLAPMGEFGGGGRWPGAFAGVGSVAVDSRGNIYTGETFEGKRVQKFAPRR